MKRMLNLGLAALVAVAMAASCSDAGDVSVAFALTDAPIDESAISAVNVTVSSVSVNESADAQIADDDGSWKTVTIDPAVPINLLDLQDGAFEALGDPLVLTGGTQINQIRLGVDAVSIVKNDASVVEATIPSADQTGLKIVNAFQIPQSGAVTITIDFDVRKSVIEKPSGTFIVKPVLRAVIDNEAGKITGSVPAGVVTVYAYENETYVDAESTTADEDGLFFTGAYTSALATDSLTYTLAFMDAGAYDLYGADASGAVVAALADVAVTADETAANQDLVATTP